jgi:hypothetical protein
MILHLHWTSGRVEKAIALMPFQQSFPGSQKKNAMGRILRHYKALLRSNMKLTSWAAAATQCWST